MLLEDGRIGMIVKEKGGNEIGHITDLTLNSTGEIVFIVKWAIDENLSWNIERILRAIHPANVNPIQQLAVENDIINKNKESTPKREWY